MSQTLRMHQIKRIIELSQEGRGVWEITRLTGFSRNTIRNYLRRIKDLGLTASELLTLSEDDFKPLVYSDPLQYQAGRKPDTRFEDLSQALAHYCSELGKRGVTRQLLWEEYRQGNPNGYGYSQFCDRLRKYMQKSEAVMRFEHRPGEYMQVDFAGDKIGYVDRSTGEWVVCDVLVCILPYSNYMYVEALRSQRQEDFIKGLTHALQYFGGVPQSIKCDNMKTAVVRSCRYEPEFTEAMEYVSAHYGTTIMAARVRKPRDKSSVEKGVDLTYKRIYAPLRSQTFHSLEQLNAAIHTQLELFHTRPFQKKAGSRKEWFESEEKNLLKALPSSHYELRHVTHGKVQRNYHVIVGEDRHQYSVPYELIGKKLKIVYTADTVEIYENLTRVALHKRNYRKNGYTTQAQHMPANHRHVAQQKGWDDEYFLREASYIGHSVQEVVKRILGSRVFYEQSFNSCRGILRLAKQYGNLRLEAACQRALDSPYVNFGLVDRILKNHLDKIPLTEKVQDIPHHDQIRGSETYK